jgi:hypothetical protein
LEHHTKSLGIISLNQLYSTYNGIFTKSLSEICGKIRFCELCGSA